MRSGSLSRSRSRSPSQGLSDKANNGSDDDSDSVTIIIHKGLGGQHLATCKVYADASIGQLVARLKADPSIDGIDSHAIMNAEVAIGNLSFRLDDYYCKFMRTRPVKQAIRKLESGARQLSVTMIERARPIDDSHQ